VEAGAARHVEILLPLTGFQTPRRRLGDPAFQRRIFCPWMPVPAPPAAVFFLNKSCHSDSANRSMALPLAVRLR
jgi:hypothetical protein